MQYAQVSSCSDAHQITGGHVSLQPHSPPLPMPKLGTQAPLQVWDACALSSSLNIPAFLTTLISLSLPGLEIHPGRHPCDCLMAICHLCQGDKLQGSCTVVSLPHWVLDSEPYHDCQELAE